MPVGKLNKRSFRVHCLIMIGQFCQHSSITDTRVVSRFVSSRFHPTSRRLFPFYYSNIMLRTDLLTFGVTGAVFKIGGEMRRLLAYFDNPADTDEIWNMAAVRDLSMGAVVSKSVLNNIIKDFPQ